MSNRLTGKVVVITGASSGIGALMAEGVAREGGIPVLMARSTDKLEQVASRMNGEFGIHRLDVTSTEQVYTVMEAVLAKYGKIDVLVNNAGYGVFETLEKADLGTIEDMMDVNYMGTVRCTKAVLPAMLKAGSGHIVNIASMAGKIGSAKSSGYSATKHAVLGFTNCIRQELLRSGIAVTAVNPGPIDTPFFDRADPSGQYASSVKWFMLRPERVSEAVITAIVKRKAEIDLPLMAAAGIRLYQLLPRVFDRVAHKMLNKK
ncbi:SDR family NAD(P)-dependent oxidoreductase [Paenibacillus sp. MBLB4367]|uniref:SDR family NAD(P)-dependent oxidoreductase n=1 Tax=Paenibacillus sp. MBLB4367 TaxID=3384767 RepID=UPI0039083925